MTIIILIVTLTVELLLFTLSAIGTVVPDILDWGKFIISTWMRVGFVLLLWSLGMVLEIWAMIILGLAQSCGGRQGLI